MSIRILGIAGSLRRQSYNRAALRAATQLVPQDASLEVFELDGIPGFNQDEEKNPPSESGRTETPRSRYPRHLDRDAGIQLFGSRRAQERDRLGFEAVRR